MSTMSGDDNDNHYMSISSLKFLRLTLLLYPKHNILALALAYASLLPLLCALAVAVGVGLGLLGMGVGMTPRAYPVLLIRLAAAGFGCINNELVNHLLKEWIQQERPRGGPEQVVCDLLNNATNTNMGAHDYPDRGTKCVESYGFPSSHTQMMVRHTHTPISTHNFGNITYDSVTQILSLVTNISYSRRANKKKNFPLCIDIHTIFQFYNDDHCSF